MREGCLEGEVLQFGYPILTISVNPGMGFGSFNTARRTLKGYESINMIRKGQIKNVEKGDIVGQISFIHKIFGVAA